MHRTRRLGELMLLVTLVSACSTTTHESRATERQARYAVPTGDPDERNLLNMSSGLRFIAPNDPDYTVDMGYPDHFFIYSGAVDVAEYATTRPVQWPPDSIGRYRNSDPLTIAFLVRQQVEELGEHHLTWPQRALFDRIGIREQVLETDPYGNFISSGYDYGTGRNWA